MVPGHAEAPLRGRLVEDEPPLPLRCAASAVARSVATTVTLAARRRLRQPRVHEGLVVHFADGSSARVYRETAVAGPPASDPALLVVAFRLRWVRGRAHALFRAESLFNTPLFVGFPGFVSKLWLAHDERERYRGLYEWDGSAAALSYARALWWVLALVSVRGSIHFAIVGGVRRDDVLDEPGLLDTVCPPAARRWWRPVRVEAPPLVLRDRGRR